MNGVNGKLEDLELYINLCIANSQRVVKQFRIRLFMEYSHGFTKVALGNVSEMLKSRILKGFTIKAIEY